MVVVPAAVGVPLIRPAVESVNPAGSAKPAVTVAVSGPVPPPSIRLTGVIAVPTVFDANVGIVPIPAFA